jgi:hypothetical protein
MVLDNGLMAEMDQPETLLATEGGSFRSLWDRHLESHLGGVGGGGSRNDLEGMVNEEAVE